MFYFHCRKTGFADLNLDLLWDNSQNNGKTIRGTLVKISFYFCLDVSIKTGIT